MYKGKIIFVLTFSIGCFWGSMHGMGNIASQIVGNLKDAQEKNQLTDEKVQNAKKALQSMYMYATSEQERKKISKVYQKTPIDGDVSQLQQSAPQQQPPEVSQEFKNVVDTVANIKEKDKQAEEAVNAVKFLFGDAPQGEVAQAVDNAQQAAADMPGAQLGEAINRNFTVEASQ